MFRQIVNVSMLAYVFFVSWTAAFALGEWIRLPFLFVIAALAFLVIRFLIIGRATSAPYHGEDYLILLFLVSLTISNIINWNDYGWNYILAYGFVFIVLYLFIKGALYSYVSSRQLYVVNTMAVLSVGIFLTANFILHQLGIINLQAMIPRSTGTSATYLGVFNRGYAFATEPGAVGFYLNTLGPLALWYLWCCVRLSRLAKWMLTGALLFGWLVLFSASAWAFLVVSVLLSLVISVSQKHMDRRVLKTLVVMVVIVIPVVFSLASSSSVRDYFTPIYQKITLSEEASTSSSGSRVHRWKTGADLVYDEPYFGKGPRYFTSKGEPSVLSWYLMVLIEGGFVSFTILLVFLGIVLIKIIRFRHPSRIPILVGYLAGCGHLMVISTFFEPFLWLLIAIFYVQRAKYLNSKHLYA